MSRHQAKSGLFASMVLRLRCVDGFEVSKGIVFEVAEAVVAKA